VLLVPAANAKIPTDSPQLAPRGPAKASRRPRKAPVGGSPVLAGGNGRAATRGGGEVIELECGITVYPARSEAGRWRAVCHEDGQRPQCEAPTEEKLTAKLEKVKIRLEADAPNIRKPRGALIAHYLDPDRLQVSERWPRKHAHTQGRLCKLYVAPVIDAIICQDIKAGHMQQIVNSAAPAPAVSVAGRRLSGSTRQGSPPTRTSPSSARRWPAGRMGTATSSWPTPPPTAGCAGAS
jgi:hypothetical protein